MNLAAVDLNLLVAFDALMAERSVSRAAHRLGVSQPGMSKRLAALRVLLRDELFLRGREGLRPTEKALDLAEPVRAALAGLEAALGGHRAFRAETSQRTFRISASDHVATTLGPALAQRLREAAPKTTVILRLENRLTLSRALESGDLDIGVSVPPDAPAAIRREDLFSEAYVCLVSARHPTIRDALSIDDFVASPHLLITLAGDAKGFVDRMLAERGLKRRVALSAPYALVAPRIVARTDMIATLPKRVVDGVAWPDVKRFPPPLPIAPYQEAMLWHARNDNDPAHRWLRRQVTAAARELGGA